MPSQPAEVSALPSQRRNKITVFEVLSKMIGELAGKNSLGKLFQYLFKFLCYYSADFQQRFFNQYKSSILKFQIMNKVLEPNERLSVLFNQLFKNPIFVLGYFKMIFLRSYIDPLEGVAGGLSIFRQTLRFGKTPVRLIDMKNSFSKEILFKKNYSYLQSDEFAVDLIDTSYGIVDEIGLLFKLKYFDAKVQPRFKKVVGKLDEIIWMADICYQLKIGYRKYKKLLLERDELISSSGVEDEKVSSSEYLRRLEKLNEDIEVIKFALLKSSCDFGFDIIDLLNLNFVSKYIYFGFGFGSGLFNSLKTYKSIQFALQKKN